MRFGSGSVYGVGVIQADTGFGLTSNYGMVVRNLEPAMVNPANPSTDQADKFKRYRAAQRRKGMRLLRVWLPDPRLESFAVEARRQAALLRDRAEESEATKFIEASFDWTLP